LLSLLFSFSELPERNFYSTILPGAVWRLLCDMLEPHEKTSKLYRIKTKGKSDFGKMFTP
jgi:hypothetical protein